MRVSASNRRDRLRAMLADLKMPGALEAVDSVLAQADSGATTAGEAIEQLLNAQIALRNNRRLETAMRASRLPAVKTLAQFDFAFQPSLKRDQIESLHELGFLNRAENVILLGPPGVGKTHLAISLAIAAAESGRRVYYGTLAGLIESLMEAKAAGNLSRRLRVLTHPALLVVDEIGYLPVSQDGAVLFFQLINARHERASTVLTSNKGFEEWGTVLGDEVMAAALIDRLLHHCHIVNIRGNSYRMREHQDLLRSAVADPPRGSRGRDLPPQTLRHGRDQPQDVSPRASYPQSVQFSVANYVQFSIAIDTKTPMLVLCKTKSGYPVICWPSTTKLRMCPPIVPNSPLPPNSAVNKASAVKGCVYSVHGVRIKTVNKAVSNVVKGFGHGSQVLLEERIVATSKGADFIGIETIRVRPARRSKPLRSDSYLR